MAAMKAFRSPFCTWMSWRHSGHSRCCVEGCACCRSAQHCRVPSRHIWCRHGSISDVLTSSSSRQIGCARPSRQRGCSLVKEKAQQGTARQGGVRCIEAIVICRSVVSRVQAQEQSLTQSSASTAVNTIDSVVVDSSVGVSRKPRFMVLWLAAQVRCVGPFGREMCSASGGWLGLPSVRGAMRAVLPLFAPAQARWPPPPQPPWRLSATASRSKEPN